MSVNGVQYRAHGNIGMGAGLTGEWAGTNGDGLADEAIEFRGGNTRKLLETYSIVNKPHLN